MICGVFGACWGRVTVLTAGARATVITVITGVRVWCVRSLGGPQCLCTGVEGNKRRCCCVRKSCELLHLTHFHPRGLQPLTPRTDTEDDVALSQPYHTENILTTFDMSHCNPRATPADPTPLPEVMGPQRTAL